MDNTTSCDYIYICLCLCLKLHKQVIIASTGHESLVTLKRWRSLRRKGSSSAIREPEKKRKKKVLELKASCVVLCCKSDTKRDIITGWLTVYSVL